MGKKRSVYSEYAALKWNSIKLWKFISLYFIIYNKLKSGTMKCNAATCYFIRFKFKKKNNSQSNSIEYVSTILIFFFCFASQSVLFGKKSFPMNLLSSGLFYVCVWNGSSSWYLLNHQSIHSLQIICNKHSKFHVFYYTASHENDFP